MGESQESERWMGADLRKPARLAIEGGLPEVTALVSSLCISTKDVGVPLAVLDHLGDAAIQLRGKDGPARVWRDVERGQWPRLAGRPLTTEDVSFEVVRTLVTAGRALVHTLAPDEELPISVFVVNPLRVDFESVLGALHAVGLGDEGIALDLSLRSSGDDRSPALPVRRLQRLASTVKCALLILCADVLDGPLGQAGSLVELACMAAAKVPLKVVSVQRVDVGAPELSTDTLPTKPQVDEAIWNASALWIGDQLSSISLVQADAPTARQRQAALSVAKAFGGPAALDELVRNYVLGWVISTGTNALASRPGDFFTAEHLGTILVANGRPEEAATVLERALVTAEEARLENTETEATLARALVAALEVQGKHAEAVPLLRGMAKASEERHGLDSEETLALESQLTGALIAASQLVEAEGLAREVLLKCQKVLGDDHELTLGARIELGRVLQARGHLEAGSVLRQSVVELEQRSTATEGSVQGQYLTLTVSALNELAIVERDAGRYAEAEALLKRSLMAQSADMGSLDIGATSTLSLLAGVYDAQGRYAEAEDHHHRVLACLERAPGGKYSPDTYAVMNNLANTLESLGRHEEAEQMYRRALSGYEHSLGHNHPSTLLCVNNLASVLTELGRYAEAVHLFRRAVRGLEASLGAGHPDTIMTVANLAGAMDLRGQHEGAELIFGNALAVAEEVLSPTHPTLLLIVHGLASVVDNLGRYGDAEKLYRRALEGQEASLGAQHPATLSTTINLGSTLAKVGRRQEGRELLQRALEGCQLVLGEKHPITQLCVKNLADMDLEVDDGFV